MEISRTDLNRIVRILSACALIVDKYSRIAREQDKARQARQLTKKLNKKLIKVMNNDNNI
jgi:hypothetical protein